MRKFIPSATPRGRPDHYPLSHEEQRTLQNGKRHKSAIRQGLDQLTGC